MPPPSDKNQPPYDGDPGPPDPRRDPASVTRPGVRPDARPRSAGDRHGGSGHAGSGHAAAPAGTLLLREVPAHPGAPGARVIGPALEEALRVVPAARCRLYVLTDLALPSGAAPLAAALLETALLETALPEAGTLPESVLPESGAQRESTGAPETGTRRQTGVPGHVPRSALLHALAVAAPHHGRGLGRRLLDDLLMELRADGVRAVWFLPGPGDEGVCALLRSAGFTDGTGSGLPPENERTYGYHEPEIRPWAAWLVREL
ncbi:GNAT family N-acetyltransferase [Microbispora sp. ZYX-F-249]|uniref:GNAT family N-acetyltransferase n=1 Tax=Microbispora maris TaxID=3144104 RepID=A0ABV0AHI4_9ACTN